MVDPVLTDLSPDALIQRIVDSLYSAFVDVLPKLPGGEIVSVEGTHGLFTGIPFPLFNGAVRPQFAEGREDAGIETFIRHARSRAVPMLWQLPPGSRPDDLATRLEAHGFRLVGSNPGMAIDLRDVERENPPARLMIERVRDAKSIRAAASLICGSFGIPPTMQEPVAQFMEVPGAQDGPAFETYAAWTDGQMVGTSAVYYACGVAGIYNVATLESYRGRGIGRAITLAPLLDARERGYRAGILHATQMGFPVYRRLGFERYCEIPLYVWMPQ